MGYVQNVMRRTNVQAEKAAAFAEAKQAAHSGSLKTADPAVLAADIDAEVDFYHAFSCRPCVAFSFSCSRV